MIKAAQLERIEGRFAMRVFVPADMTGDIDNRLKPILDLAKEYVTDDDKFCDDLRISRSTEVPTGTCVVRITHSTTDLSSPSAGSGAAGAGSAPAPLAAA